ncbi:MAG: hypothetical protein EOP83_02565 [Verrucomicrobiaceae bacterium]|nr:MAG: hypothetical protein EOP83_02565 [Verrucomicrobiaceae bacterium]
MIVPQFWAEARVQEKTRERQVTVRRYGWSDASQEDAQAMAGARASEALRRILSGEKMERREPKVPYNGSDGVPIREEILSRQGDTIITRNSYGARCLNTPDVLFADLDFPDENHTVLVGVVFPIAFAIGIAIGILRGSVQSGLMAMGILGLTLPWVVAWCYKSYLRATGGDQRHTLRRIEKFSTRNPDWHLRVYQTPAGFRVLAMHDTFDPAGEEAARCFRALGTDKIYVRMCTNQRCFRARVSPKPWRIGISKHLRPNPGVWPVAPERLPLREAWVRDYEQRATGYAACRFVTRLGSDRIHPSAEQVAMLHDELSRATSGLPIA